MLLGYGSLWQRDHDIPCAIGVARFLIGTFPGCQSVSSDVFTRTAAPLVMPEGPASFMRYLGLNPVGKGLFVLPGTTRLGGMLKVGAFHGGFIAAASDRVAEMVLQDWAGPDGARCASLEIEYLRPAVVTADLLLEARVIHADHGWATVEVVTCREDWS